MFGYGCALWLSLLSIVASGHAYYYPPDPPPPPPPQPQPAAQLTPKVAEPTAPIATTTTSKPTTTHSRATVTTPGGFFPSDLTLDVRVRESPSGSDSPSILFPGSGGGDCPAPTSCVIIDDCPANSRGKSICGWEDNVPLICCSSSKSDHTTEPPLSLLLTKEIFPEDQCFRVTKANEKRAKRQSFPNNNPFEIDVTVDPTIIGGKDVQSNTQFPFMVGIYKQVRLASAFHCGGVVIGRSFALSAAHCFLDKDDQDVEFVARSGMVDLASVTRLDVDIETIQIEKIVVHPEFKFPVLYNDIAVLKFKQPVSFTETLKPICLPLKGRGLDEGHADVIGWGAKKFGGSESDILQVATVNVVGRNDCDTSYMKLGEAAQINFPNGIIGDLICAGNVDKPKDACQGDSGGPLVAANDDFWRLIGIVSVGFQCGVIGFPGVYTRVDHYLPWINETALSI